MPRFYIKKIGGKLTASYTRPCKRGKLFTYHCIFIYYKSVYVSTVGRSSRKNGMKWNHNVDHFFRAMNLFNYYAANVCGSCQNNITLFALRDFITNSSRSVQKPFRSLWTRGHDAAAGNWNCHFGVFILANSRLGKSRNCECRPATD